MVSSSARMPLTRGVRAASPNLASSKRLLPRLTPNHPRRGSSVTTYVTWQQQRPRTAAERSYSREKEEANSITHATFPSSWTSQIFRVGSSMRCSVDALEPILMRRAVTLFRTLPRLAEPESR